MTKYTYVLKADQQTGGYNSSYRNMDIVVTVVAETWDLAQEEAKRILPPLKSSTSSWAFWSKSITPYEEPWPPPPVIDEQAFEPSARKKLRLRGVR